MKRALLALLALCGLGTALYLVSQERDARAKDRHADTAESGAPATPAHPIAFAEIAAWAGVYDLAAGWGISWSDVDGDDDLDLFISNHMHYPSALYLNEGGVRFRPADGALGRAVGLDDHLGVWADFDADGDQDVFTTNGFYRADHLMINSGSGNFEEGSADWGLVEGEKGRGRSALWADFDGDGWLDLFVLNLYSPDVYYHREPGGIFRVAGAEACIVNSLRKDGASAGDVDGDGDLDLYVPLLQPRQRNLLFLNRGDGIFVERAAEAGVDLEGGSSNCAMGDYDGDGDLDLYVTRSGGRGDVLFQNQGDGTFEDATKEAGLGIAAEGIRSAGFADFDNDGWLDLYVSCGGQYDGPNAANALYRNRADGTFEELAELAGVAGIAPGNSASFAFADYNLDGFMDIAATNGGGARAISGPHQLFRNQTEGPTGANWLRVAARGGAGNPDGIGARVTVHRADGVVVTREAGVIRTMAQDEPFVHVGLGPLKSARSVEVRWPSGGSARVQGVPAGETLWIYEPQEPRFVASHPAALLGDEPAFDAEKLQAALVEHGLERLPAADELDLEWRRAEVLARALARDIAASVGPSDGEMEAAQERLTSEAALPARYYIEQVGVGIFTTMARKPLLPWDIAKLMGQGMRKGGDVLELMNEHGVRAWARRRLNETTRGYLEEGWLTQEMLRERYGEQAPAILELREGAVLGPVPVREGRDLQDPSQTWPILRLFRMVAKAPPTSAVPASMRADLVRSLQRQKLRQALRSAESEAPAALEKAGAAGRRAGIGMLSYDVVKLAAVARARGYERREEIQRAFTRAALEAELETGVRELVLAAQPSQTAFELALSRTAEWTVPVRVRGVKFYFPTEDLAREARARIESGAGASEVIEELSIPSITDPDARNLAHYELVTLDAATWSRSTIEGRFDELSALAPGAPSSVHSSDEGFLFFVQEERLPAQPLATEEALRRARSELARAAARKLADELMGL
jgi:hypothetical protein